MAELLEQTYGEEHLLPIEEGYLKLGDCPDFSKAINHFIAIRVPPPGGGGECSLGDWV